MGCEPVLKRFKNRTEGQREREILMQAPRSQDKRMGNLKDAEKDRDRQRERERGGEGEIGMGQRQQQQHKRKARGPGETEK